MEVNRVWERMVEAETRSMYFADLASRYTKRKQFLNATVFFLTSGAAATIYAKQADWVPILASSAAAIITAYQVAFNLDKLIASLVKLHLLWNELHCDSERLWQHCYEEDAERVRDDIQRRSRQASELGTEMPYNRKLLRKWEDQVNAQYAGQANAAAAVTK